MNTTIFGNHDSWSAEMLTIALLIILFIHLAKFIWEQAFGPSKKHARQQAQALLGELFSERPDIKNQLFRVLRLGMHEHSSVPVTSDYKVHAEALLRTLVKHGDFTVGIKGTRYLQQACFLDAMAGTLNGQIRKDLATTLTSQLAISRQHNDRLKDVHQIVGIKRGSPWLAIEVANRLNMPIAIHRGEDRVNSSQNRPENRFDGPLKTEGSALIVDDSITGGTMVLQAIEDLKRLKVGVDCCLVLFEVLGKAGRAGLSDAGVNLIAVFTYDGRDNELKAIDGPAIVG